MVNAYQRARKAACDRHRCIITSEAWFCICSEPKTIWYTTERMFWSNWGMHVSAKIAEMQEKLDGSKST